MFDEVKGRLNEIISIAEKCPEKYQVKCFEVLLNALVQRESTQVLAAGVSKSREKVGITLVSEFFSQYDISEAEWPNVFNNEGNTWEIIVTDLKETAKSKQQEKLALLLGVKGLLETGTPLVSRDSLIALCKEHAAYDRTNFAKHMKKAKQLLLPRDDDWVLTQPGKKKAAEVIKELAQ